MTPCGRTRQEGTDEGLVRKEAPPHSHLNRGGDRGRYCLGMLIKGCLVSGIVGKSLIQSSRASPRNRHPAKNKVKFAYSWGGHMRRANNILNVCMYLCVLKIGWIRNNPKYRLRLSDKLVIQVILRLMYVIFWWWIASLLSIVLCCGFCKYSLKCLWT